MTDDIAQFLLARIAEVEAVAKAATPGPWRSEDGQLTGADEFGNRVSLIEGSAYVGIPGSGEIRIEAGDVEHITRHEPTSVLARCEADRAIVEEHSRAYVLREDLPPELTPVETSRRSDSAVVEVHFGTGGVELMNYQTYRERFMEPAPPSKTLRLLALPHATHPDYREEWKP